MPENFPSLRRLLKQLNREGCLKNVILIGSWATYLYQHHFKSAEYHPQIRTTDVDFLIPRPSQVDPKLDLNMKAILEELNYVQSFSRNGLVRYESKDLTVEFLVPELGRGIDKPIQVRGLNVSAVALRFLQMLAENPMVLSFDRMRIRVPDPIAYLFHKLIISDRRLKIEKRIKDYRSAVELLVFLKKQGQSKVWQFILKR